MSVFDYQVKEYRKKSKQVNNVFKAKWKLQVIDKPKKCDTCGDLTSPDGKQFIALLSTNGVIFYFCSLECIHDFIDKELKEIEEKTKRMVI